MRSTGKILVVMVLFFILTGLPGMIVRAEETEDVIINETTFPDDNFRNYIIGSFDKDGDKVIKGSEISQITTIQCGSKQIKDLKGIEYFTALQSLSCEFNQLSILDVSQNIKLTELNCMSNKLSSLNIRMNAELKRLVCTNNQLRSLNVSQNIKLRSLECDINSLTALDVSKNTALDYINCHGNKLQK